MSTLRFASLIRVSTEQQEKHGESLLTQRKGNAEDAGRVGGHIVGTYGGQEHATPGHERKELDRLIADAAKGKFNAVIVANADRWSRDNAKSTKGLEVFREHEIRFFVGTTEYDLFNPEHRLFLGMAAVFGEFQARHQSKKSIVNRIARARQGKPTCGKLPFGRTFDSSTGQWGIDPAKKAMIEDVAHRYLAGESLPKLAEQYGVNHANLHKILTQRSGDEWVQEFYSSSLNIRETIRTKVPRLLPEETIRAVRSRVAANRTYLHGQSKHAYLLGRMVFCSHCGYAMFGQTNQNGKRYYRHAHTKRDRKCPCPKAWVNADELEFSVFRDLFDWFGNPVAVQRAVEEAIPNRDRIAEMRRRKGIIEGELAKLETAKDRLIRSIAKGIISDDDAAKERTRLREREMVLRDELRQIGATIDDLPDAEEIKATAERVSAKFRVDAKLWAITATLNSEPEQMPWEERRALVQMVFGGKTAEGQRMGVHVEWVEGSQSKRRKEWVFGRLAGSSTNGAGSRALIPMPRYLEHRFRRT